MTSATAAPGFFDRAPAGLLVFWALSGAIAGASVLVAVLAAASGGSIGEGWHGGFATLAALLLLPLPFFTLQQLQAQRQVWLGRVAPLAAWHRTLDDHRRTLLLSWALAALPLVALRLLARPEGEAWATTAWVAVWPAALLAALLGLGLLAAAAWSGLLSWRWGVAAAAALVALSVPGAAGMLFAPSLALAPAGLRGLVGAALLVLTAAAAMLCSRVVDRRLAQEPAAGDLGPGPVQRLLQRWQGFTERWRRIDSPADAGLLVVLGSQLPNNLANPNVDARFLQPWGSGITVMHGLRIAVLTLVALVLLRGALVHWRVLLSPGGRFRRAIGLRIVGSTLLSLLFVVGLWLAVMALVFTLLPFLPAVPWQRLPALAVAHAPPLLADLALAVALAAWLRGALGSLGRAALVVCVAGVLLLAGAFIVAPVLGFEGAAQAVLATRGPAYVAAQLALAALCLLGAQRAWARADLGELARRPPPSPQDDGR